VGVGVGGKGGGVGGESAAAEKVIESSTISKGKRKAAPARAKVYAEMDGPVSNLIHCRQSALT
jgi:hypothetical protein